MKARSRRVVSMHRRQQYDVDEEQNDGGGTMSLGDAGETEPNTTMVIRRRNHNTRETQHVTIIET
jgi:hypothetical protein